MSSGARLPGPIHRSLSHAVAAGPWPHPPLPPRRAYWYDFAQPLTDDLTRGVGSDASLLLAKTTLSVALEQFVMIPVYFSLYLIPISTLQNGESLRQVPAAIGEKLPDLFISNAKLWTPANVIIYNLPIQWRSLASNLFDLVWGVIASNSVNVAACDGVDADECIIDEPPCENVETCIISTPSIARGRGLPRLAMRRVRRQFAGMGHALWDLEPAQPAVTDAAITRADVVVDDSDDARRTPAAAATPIAPIGGAAPDAASSSRDT